jgi:rod shape determining protein RodA
MAVRVAERGDKTEPARIAVGNGGLFGQGIFRGAQTRPNSTESTDLYGRVAAAATCCRLGFQAVEGIGRCPDIMPVTGVPLAAGR